MSQPVTIPAPRVAFIDQRTGNISREWYMFLLTFFNHTAGATIDLSGVDVSKLFDGQIVQPGKNQEEYPPIPTKKDNPQEYPGVIVKNEYQFDEFYQSIPRVSAPEEHNYLLLLGKIRELESQIANLDTQRVNWLKLPIDLVNFVIEKDGTLVFKNDGTVWKDIMFPQSPPKTTGAGNPSLVTWNGSMRGFSYAVNDVHDFDSQEIEHDAKVGATATWHIHFVSRDNETQRTVKYQLEYAVEPESGAIPALTTVSAEFIIPAATAVNTPFHENIATFAVPAIAHMVYVRLTRIASSGTEPTTDPIVSGIHFHYELDTVGSREIHTK